jgi:hypothetical protein
VRTDINTFVGEYPYRDVGPTGIGDLWAALQVIGVTEAWVSHLPSVFRHDPASGNDALLAACANVPGTRAVVAVHPGMPAWERVLDRAVAAGAVCVRCDPMQYGLDPLGPGMHALVAACAERALPLMMAVRFEDSRQRHPNDGAGDLQPWMVRGLIRSCAAARLVITHADREFVEQVHFGSTPAEAERILWDICWIWGPPEDHLALLLDTVGVRRFAFGSGAPLRIADTSAVKLELLECDAGDRALIDHANARAFLGE